MCVYSTLTWAQFGAKKCIVKQKNIDEVLLIKKKQYRIFC